MTPSADNGETLPQARPVWAPCPEGTSRLRRVAGLHPQLPRRIATPTPPSRADNEHLAFTPGSPPRSFPRHQGPLSAFQPCFIRGHFTLLCAPRPRSLPCGQTSPHDFFFFFFSGRVGLFTPQKKHLFGSPQSAPPPHLSLSGRFCGVRAGAGRARPLPSNGSNGPRGAVGAVGAVGGSTGVQSVFGQ